MALTYSTMLPLGTKMPDFQLKNVLDDKLYTSSTLMNAKPSLIMVICNHCPYVIHYHDEIKKLANDFGHKIDFVAISSNDIISYPQDGPAEMKALFHSLKLSFPYLLDETLFPSNRLVIAFLKSFAEALISFPGEESSILPLYTNKLLLS